MKNVVITGSTRGIGLAMAGEFLKAGCRVTISGRGKDMPEEPKKELSIYKDSFFYVMCDVRDNSDLEKLWKRSWDRWGKVDIWINNAGQNCPYEFCYLTEALYVDALIDTNIKGVIFGSQIAARNMINQGFGQIWNMEGLGSNDMVQEKTIIYGTSKRALTYFTKALARELRKTNVTAGRLSPGMMLTEFITKTPEGKESPVLKEKDFKFIFNLLADKPETVAKFFIPRILSNKKNNAHIVWLTSAKTLWRFLSSLFNKRRLLP